LFVLRTRLSAVLAQDHLVPPPLTSAEFFDRSNIIRTKKIAATREAAKFCTLVTAIVGVVTKHVCVRLG